MLVVFLDIDGVLNNPGTYSDGGDGAPWRREPDEPLRVPVEPACMARLNRLIAETGAKIVISSSWRLFSPGCRWESEDANERGGDLAQALKRYGLLADIIGDTPDLVNDPVWLEAWRTREGAPFHYERIERGMEISEWLSQHPEVTGFAILDDCSDMATVKPRLVLCDPTVGLDDPDVERAKWMLAQPRAC